MEALVLSDSEIGALLKAHAEQQQMFKAQARSLAESRELHEECLESTRRQNAKIDKLDTKIDKLVELTAAQEERLDGLDAAQAEDEQVKRDVSRGAKAARWLFSSAFGALVGVVATVGASHLDHRDRINRLETTQAETRRAGERHEELDEREHRAAAEARQGMQQDVAAMRSIVELMQAQQTEQKHEANEALRDLRSEVSRLRRIQ